MPRPSRRWCRRRETNLGRADFGSTLRDAAAVVMLAAEGNAPQPAITAAVQKVEAARDAAFYTSTQEEAWMVLAARALGKQTRLSLEVGGEAHQGPLYRTVRAAELQANPLKVTNTGDAPLRAVVSVGGAPVTPEPAAEKGFKIERLYLHASTASRPTPPGRGRISASRWCSRSPSQPAIRPPDRRRLSAGRLRNRQPAPGVVGRHRNAQLDF